MSLLKSANSGLLFSTRKLPYNADRQENCETPPRMHILQATIHVLSKNPIKGGITHNPIRGGHAFTLSSLCNQTSNGDTYQSERFVSQPPLTYCDYADAQSVSISKNFNYYCSSALSCQHWRIVASVMGRIINSRDPLPPLTNRCERESTSTLHFRRYDFVCCGPEESQWRVAP